MPDDTEMNITESTGAIILRELGELRGEVRSYGHRFDRLEIVVREIDVKVSNGLTEKVQAIQEEVHGLQIWRTEVVVALRRAPRRSTAVTRVVSNISSNWKGWLILSVLMFILVGFGLDWWGPQDILNKIFSRKLSA